MKNTITLRNNYKYSIEHKSLIFWPTTENYLGNRDKLIEYRKRLQELYNNTFYHDKNIQFIELNTEMIKNAINFNNQVIFEVTEKCNLTCTYCGYGDVYKKSSGERLKDMDWQTAKTVLDFFIKKWQIEKPKNMYRYCHIGFYGGEPLLNIQLIKRIVSYTEKYGESLEFRYFMTTNGTLLEKHINYLIEKDVVLAVSIDGNRKMNSYRIYKNGKEVYDEVFSVLKTIKKKYTKYFERNVELFSVAHNKNSTKGIVSFFKREFGKRPKINKLSSNMVADFGKWNSIRRQNLSVKNEENDYHRLLEYLKLFSGNAYMDYKALFDDTENVIKTPTGTCVPFSFRAFASARKKIYPCERIGFVYPLGKVINGDVEINFEGIVNFYNKLFRRFRNYCEKCYKKEACDFCILTNEKHIKENLECEEFCNINCVEKCISESIKIFRDRTIDFNTIYEKM